MTVELFFEPLSKRYYASRLSCAYLVSIICTIVVVAVPFLLCDNSVFGGIWLKHESYREKPDMEFSHRVIIELKATSPTNEVSSDIFFSTVGSLNALRSGSSGAADVRSRHLDDDLDGIMDGLTINAMVPLLGQERIQSVKAIVFLTCRLHKNSKIKMESIAYVEHDSSLPGSTFVTRGDAVFRQTVPLVINDDISSLYSDEPLLDGGTAPFGTRPPSIDAIVQKYSKRNFVMEYNERFHFWKEASFNDISTIGGFNFTFTMDVNEQQIDFVPTLPDVLKNFWIRYLSLLLVVEFLLRKIVRFVFSQQIVQTNVVVNGS